MALPLRFRIETRFARDIGETSCLPRFVARKGNPAPRMGPIKSPPRYKGTIDHFIRHDLALNLVAEGGALITWASPRAVSRKQKPRNYARGLANAE
jgi:hypothetical protein